MKSKKAPDPQTIRYPFFDTYRGFALILMAIYHFSFDLNQFGLIHQNMNFDEFWLDFRAVIMTSFLSLVGISFVFAKTQYENRNYRARLKKIFLCALLISAGTYFLNPQTWIFFGVLHFIFVASLIAPLLVRFPKSFSLLGIGIVLLPIFYRSFWFNRPILLLSGLSPIKPITEDFSPIFPWLGVVCVGVGIGFWVKIRKPDFAQKLEIPQLSKLGRHSLLFYMTHQLVLFPLAWLLAQVFA